MSHPESRSSTSWKWINLSERFTPIHDRKLSQRSDSVVSRDRSTSSLRSTSSSSLSVGTVEASSAESSNPTNFSGPTRKWALMGASSGMASTTCSNEASPRQLNAAIHRIALTQASNHPPAHRLLDRRTTNGNTKKEAMRVLKRRLSDVVYRALDADTAHLQDSQLLAA